MSDKSCIIGQLCMHILPFLRNFKEIYRNLVQYFRKGQVCI